MLQRSSVHPACFADTPFEMVKRDTAQFRIPYPKFQITSPQIQLLRESDADETAGNASQQTPAGIAQLCSWEKLVEPQALR